MSESTNDAEKILENLSQEERLKLLERLIQGASEAKEESLTVEERLERLEDIVLGGHRGGKHHKKIIIRRRGGRGSRWDIDDIDDSFFCC